MLAKKYRLGYKEVQRVLKYSKPFFSTGYVLNRVKNNLGYSRHAIVVSGKSTKNAVIRNAFRRRYYHIVEGLMKDKDLESYDYVFVVKNKTLLSLDENKQVSAIFDKEIKYLYKKSLK